MRFLWLILFPVLPSCNIHWCMHMDMEPSKPCPKKYEQFPLAYEEFEIDDDWDIAYREGSGKVDIIKIPFSN